MKILIIHRNFHLDGGDSTYTLKLAQLLQKNYDVNVLTMKDIKNERLLVNLIELPNLFTRREVTRFKDLEITAKIKYGLNSIFSFDVYNATRKLLEHDKYDIIHIQNIHHVLTSSVVYAILDKGIPIVWTLHDYKLLCPASNFFRNGNVCEKCKKNKFYYVTKYRCKRNSLFASLSVMISSYLDELLSIKKSIDKFITPSNFLREKLIEYGVDEKKVINIPHFVLKEDRNNNKRGKYILYYGNLSKEKGVDLLLNICKEIKDIPFIFVGAGPLEKEVKEAACIEKNITHYSFLDQHSIKKLIQEARLVVVPSQWYENFPFSILEPMSFGKAVIASKTGGIPEIIIDGVNGVLVYKKNSLTEWVEKIQQTYYDDNKVHEYEVNAYKTIKKFSPEKHSSELESLYNEVISNKSII